MKADQIKKYLSKFYDFGKPKKGKRVLIISGVHGGENTPIEISKKLIKYLQNKKINGLITIIPIVNLAGYKKQTRINPKDGKNINSAGTQKGKKPKPYTISDKIADYLIELANDYDYFLDLHSASSARYLQHAYASNSEDLELARSFGTKFVILARTSTKASKGKYKNAIETRIREKYKIPSFALELGAGVKVFQKDVKLGFLGILNFLNKIGIIANIAGIKKIKLTPKKYVFNILRDKVFYRKKINQTGLVYFNKEIGEKVKQGETIGYITNKHSKKAIKAEKSGLLIYKRIVPKIKKEDIGKEEFYKILTRYS